VSIFLGGPRALIQINRHKNLLFLLRSSPPKPGQSHTRPPIA
jgi:hypothetical protein